MAQLLKLDTFTAESGDLTVFEKLMPGFIKRFFYVYETDEPERFGYRHRTAWHALICLNGSCRMYTNDGADESFFVLDNPQKCLIVEPKDWYQIDQFSPGGVLLVMSNDYYHPEDIIYEKYP
ncbi:sugar 3,4-ketoisomerase [Larkinella rosea]|uniref:WxcM-like domain-containing protein n=1 Tax=Larkinella rosea TaxID=2025312 RepID=A0A3P1B9F2_9BACT|nr:FdtA/QdtA family cupin domain-containing protein [Larkinella rosea]RRA97685.1 WxcM-like domain-containing protein [Larkinella rosea]